MSEITDLVMPTLKKIQEQMADMEKSIKQLDDKVSLIDERLKTNEHWTMHAIGLGTVARAEAELSLAHFKLLSKKLDSNDN